MDQFHYWFHMESPQQDFSLADCQSTWGFGPKTHQPGGFEGGDKPGAQLVGFEQQQQ